MITLMVESDRVILPDWVKDLESFRRWADSDDYPEQGRICYLNGSVWIDMSNEQVYTHAKVKGEYNRVLGNLAKDGNLGHMFPDGILLTNVAAGFCCGPDALFVCYASLDDRVRSIEGRTGGVVELEGAPDMTLEVVSRSSVYKDTVVLRRTYWEAGVREYWLVDARREPVQFDILRHGKRGYIATRKNDGWLKSQVFGKSFRLVQHRDPKGNPDFTLEVR